MVIYDRHEVLWLYGKQDLFEGILLEQEFASGVVAIPTPHFHNYKKEFDANQNSIVECHEFVHFPLQDPDSE